MTAAEYAAVLDSLHVETEEHYRPGYLVPQSTWLRRPTATCASLGHHVGGVVGGRANEEVRWVDAISNVAVMTNEKPGRDFSEMNLPGDSVSVGDSARRACWEPDVDCSVTLGVKGADPEPARFRALHLLPEANLEGYSLRWSAFHVPSSGLLRKLRGGQREVRRHGCRPLPRGATTT